MAKTQSVAAQLNEILLQYDEKLSKVANDAMKKVSKECVQKLKNTSPAKTGDYRKGWGTKTERGRSGIGTITIHNKTDYQLTHLLENGHVVRNAKGTYGRAPAIVHIKPVEDYAISEFPAEVERGML